MLSFSRHEPTQKGYFSTYRRHLAEEYRLMPDFIDEKEKLLDFSRHDVKLAYREYINLRKRKMHLNDGHLAKFCDIRTVERYFKGPIENMPKKLPENSVYGFLNIVESQYDDFVEYYHSTHHASVKSDVAVSESIIGDKSSDNNTGQDVTSSLSDSKPAPYQKYLVRTLIALLLIGCATAVIIGSLPGKEDGYIKHFFCSDAH